MVFKLVLAVQKPIFQTLNSTVNPTWVDRK